MGLIDKFKSGLNATRKKLSHEITRIFSGSPKLGEETLEELEFALIGADLGIGVTNRIVSAIKQAYESQGSDGVNVITIARQEIVKVFDQSAEQLCREDGLTIISMVGVNGTGKTTTSAKLAHRLQLDGKTAMIAACDTFRAAAVEQTKQWGQRLDVPVIAGSYGADPASVAHDAVAAAQARNLDYLIIDTAGRLHTKSNLMAELEKLHRVVGKQIPGAPQEVLLVVDATTGMNALNQAREFHKTVPLTGLVITKLDGTSKGGMVVAIQDELRLPIKFVGLGEQADDLQPFDPNQFAEALFSAVKSDE
ncbi:MAG: signal recognition particle-docking protein FtsY [Verrucomicrobiales bacterium]|nr:signal recognition particle-docking protein FtsY [Verrucomicrobiales bacterium]|tara:strand:+ start:919 stop:1842 length:924 start_codon:yes stop_codon:yes gene_type:complete